MPTQPYTHIYTNYVNHILNHSPSKTTYTFPKSQRFSSPSINNTSAPLDQIIYKLDDKNYQNQNLLLSDNNNYISQSYQKHNNNNNNIKNNWIDNQIRQVKHKLNKTYTIHDYRIEQQLNDMRLAKPKDKSLSKSKSNVNINMKKNKSYKNIYLNINNKDHTVFYDNLQALSPKNKHKQKTARSRNNNSINCNNNNNQLFISPSSNNTKFQPSLHTRSKSYSKFSPKLLNQISQKSIPDKSMIISSLYNNNINNNIINKKKTKSKSKSKSNNNKTKSPKKHKKQSPVKYLNTFCNNNSESKKDIHRSDSKYLKYSPYYNSNHRPYHNHNNLTQHLPDTDFINEFTFSHQIKRPCKQHQRDLNYYQLSPAKKAIYTTTQILQQINHPSKKITPHGYYPIGVQISQKGKYPVSTYKNVIGHSFGPPPKQKQGHGYKSPEKRHTLHINNHPNNVFIQSDKKNNKKFCYSDMMKQLNEISINPYNLNVDPDQYNDKRVYTENYIPFSEFGNYKKK